MWYVTSNKINGVQPITIRLLLYSSSDTFAKKTQMYEDLYFVESSILFYKMTKVFRNIVRFLNGYLDKWYINSIQVQEFTS